METTTHYFFWSIRSCLALLMVPCGFRVDLPGMGMTAESPNIRRWLFESLKFWLIFGENSTASLRDFLLDYVLDGGFSQIGADVAHLVHGAESVDRSAFAVDDFRVERFKPLFASDVGDFLVVVRITAVQSAV